MLIIAVYTGDEPIFEAQVSTMAFFNNYNTVESYLLCSAIMIAIAAIMFESQQLSTLEQDSLAYLVICIVAVSLGYFVFVLGTELWVAFFPHLPLWWMHTEGREVEEEMEGDIEFAAVDLSMERGRRGGGGRGSELDGGGGGRSSDLTAEYEAKLEDAEGNSYDN